MLGLPNQQRAGAVFDFGQGIVDFRELGFAIPLEGPSPSGRGNRRGFIHLESSPESSGSSAEDSPGCDSSDEDFLFWGEAGEDSDDDIASGMPELPVCDPEALRFQEEAAGTGRGLQGSRRSEGRLLSFNELTRLRQGTSGGAFEDFVVEAPKELATVLPQLLASARNATRWAGPPRPRQPKLALP